MKKVILIGDSIRMHYQDTVMRELAGMADVWAPVENGEKSIKVLSHLEEWAISRNPDIVQINCGLHDLKRKTVGSEPAVPLVQYQTNVRTILEQAVARTNSRIIWATTTPVNEKWHHENKDFERLESDVLAYNAAANQIAGELGVVVNDLNDVIMQAGRDAFLKPDGVHFTDEGSRLLGQSVANFLKSYLE
jgi:lysophospholipase L1-like esterase